MDLQENSLQHIDANDSPMSTLAEIAAGMPTHDLKAKIKKNPLGPDAMFGKFLILEGWSHWVFRLGFASIFFVNAVYAAVEPKSFSDMLIANPIANLLGHADFMVKIAMVNDLLLTVFIIGGWRKKMVYAWAGAWLLLVAGLKLMNLFV